ncbi:MAG: flagellar hook-associated protein FlgK [Ilumatobacteraceae bacterium]
MPNISSLNTGLSGMNAQRRAMDLIGHNVANAATPGYHRQRAELRGVGAPINGLFSGAGVRPYGVEVIGVSRSYDALLAARAVREQASSAFAELSSTTLSRIEGLFPEPTDVGIAHQLHELWSGWTDVANDPGSLASRTQLLERASSLVSSLHRTAADIAGVRATAIDRVSTLAAETNGLAAEVAALNAQIASTPSAAHDLLDRRELILTELAALTGAQARSTERGQVDVYIGGRAIVTGTVSHAIVANAGTLEWAIDGQSVNAAAGEAAALFGTITDVAPRYTALLDQVAATLVAEVNALHVAGYDQNGVTGRNFFDPAGVTAATIELSVDVAGTPANIAAGEPQFPGPTAPGSLDGEQARAIAALADSAGGADARYRALIAGLAVETRGAIRRAEIQAQVTDAAISDAESVGSVSIDEEMANLVGAQRAYEASARFLTVVDELLGVLIERTGVVGR